MTENKLNFTLNADQELIAREVPSQRILEIAIKAPMSAARASRPALNLALVLDRSGSMSDGKLEYVKQAASHVLDLLNEQDRVALVAFDDEINLLSPSLPVTAENRADMQRRIQPLDPGGSTNLSGGWLTGCQEIAAAAQEHTLNRALLLTDGQANQGITELEELATHARELARRGISTTTFGVGQGFNEHLLEAMSNQGGGSFYYIETPQQIPELFNKEFAELATITLREVEVVVDVPEKVSAVVLGGWRWENRAGKLHIFVGSLNAGRSQEIYVKLLTSPSHDLEKLVFAVQLSGLGEDGQARKERAELTFRYASQKESDTAPRHRELLQRYAGVDLAETAGEALKLERAGEGEKASRLLKQSLADNSPYADSAKMKEYENLSQRMKHGMDEADRKTTHQNAYNQKRRREP
jgi:Ca-activated chloride channel family protein